MPFWKKKPIGKERVLKELKESLAHKIALRRKAPIIGLIFFSLALWGSKLFTWLSPIHRSGVIYLLQTRTQGLGRII